MPLRILITTRRNRRFVLQNLGKKIGSLSAIRRQDAIVPSCLPSCKIANNTESTQNNTWLMSSNGYLISQATPNPFAHYSQKLVPASLILRRWLGQIPKESIDPITIRMPIEIPDGKPTKCEGREMTGKMPVLRWERFRTSR